MKFVDHNIVGRFHMSTGCISKEMADEMPHKKILSGIADDFFEIGKVFIRFTRRELARAIDFDCRRFAFRGDGILRTPTSNWIDGIQRT